MGFFLWRSKAGKSKQNSDPVPTLHHPSPGEIGGGHQEYYGAVDEKATEGSHAVEIGGIPVQKPIPPMELPADG